MKPIVSALPVFLAIPSAPTAGVPDSFDKTEISDASEDPVSRESVSEAAQPESSAAAVMIPMIPDRNLFFFIASLILILLLYHTGAFLFNFRSENRK
jgi:hypothetical protein